MMVMPMMVAMAMLGAGMIITTVTMMIVLTAPTPKDEGIAEMVIVRDVMVIARDVMVIVRDVKVLS